MPRPSRARHPPLRRRCPIGRLTALAVPGDHVYAFVEADRVGAPAAAYDSTATIQGCAAARRCSGWGGPLHGKKGQPIGCPFPASVLPTAAAALRRYGRTTHVVTR